jgi:CARDB
MEDPKPPHQAHEDVRRQLRGALWLLLVTVIATTAGVWASVKYSEFAFNVGQQNQLAGAAAAAAPAGTIPLSGWMWSGYMGWISLSSDNKSEGNTYAVYENVSTGGLSGYAWSGNLGWVSFNAADVASCPSGGAAPSVNLSTGKVSGWARACSAFSGSACSGTLDTRSGGWDGCISLGTQTGETATYGITQDLATCKWSGYAWGSTAIGWTNSNPIISGIAYGVTCEKPNLKYISATPLPLTGSVTAPITYTATFTNVGGARTNSLFEGSTFPIHYSFRWADNAQGTNWTTMIPAGFPTSADVAAGETVTKSVSFQFPSSAAGTTRYIDICADYNSTVAESNENDNCSGWTAVTLAGTANLVPSPIAPTPSTAAVNVAQNFSTTIINSGSASAGSSYVIFRKANDAQGTGAVDLTPSVSVSALAVNAQATAVKSISFATAGTFYLQVCADVGDLIDEGAGEADNCTTWVPITVGAPDLQQDQIGWQGGPPTTGTQIAFTGSIKNTGPAAISGGVPSVYRVKNGLSPTAKVWAVLDAGTVPSIAANTAGVALTTSQGYSTSTPGTLYVDICANASVATPTTMTAPPVNTAELAASAGNNCGQIMQIPISLSQVVPNYKVSVAPTVIGSPIVGGSLTFSAIIRNASSTAATSTSNMRFQVDTDADGAGFGAGTWVSETTNRPVPMLAGNTSDIARTSPTAWTVPGTPGAYRVRACADLPPNSYGYIGEGSENDNCGAETLFTVGGLPDVQANAVTASKTNPVINEAITINTTVTNFPTASASATNFPTVIQILYPTDPLTNIKRITTIPATTTLAVGATSGTLSASFATSTPGQYRVRACANMYPSGATVIAESNTGNNCSTSLLTITVGSGAVAPTVINPTKTSITGTGATLGATVSNNGGAPLSAGGTCWSTLAFTPPNCPNQLPRATVPTVGTPYTHARTGMPGNTLIYYRGYATNSYGLTGYSAQDTFTTLSTALGITVNTPYTKQYPSDMTANVTYTLTNGTAVNTQCRILDNLQQPLAGALGTYTACDGSESVVPPNGATTYRYYVQAFKSITAETVISNPFDIIVQAPDLRPGTAAGAETLITPTTATANLDATFSQKFTNRGAASSGNGFTVLFQVATDDQGAGAADIGTFSQPSAVVAGATITASRVHRFTSAGTFYLRACADKSAAANPGTISESNALGTADAENNNCGGWTQITVGSGQTFSCTGLPANATPYPAPDNTGLTANTAYTFSATDTAAKCQFGSCTSGYTWNSSTGTCVQDPPPGGDDPSITCTRNPNTSITTGQSIAFTVTPADGAAGPYEIRNGATTLCTPTGTPATCSSTFSTTGTFSITARTTSGSPTPGLSAPCGADIVVSPVAGTAPTINSFTADPTRDEAGYTTTLTWTSTGTGAQGCTITRLSGGVTDATWKTGLAGSGNTTDTVNGETVYTLTCTNDYGSDSEEIIADTNPIICEIGQNC